jgi:hypothetical protein
MYHLGIYSKCYEVLVHFRYQGSMIQTDVPYFLYCLRTQCMVSLYIRNTRYVPVSYGPWYTYRTQQENMKKSAVTKSEAYVYPSDHRNGSRDVGFVVFCSKALCVTDCSFTVSVHSTDST